MLLSRSMMTRSPVRTVVAALWAIALTVQMGCYAYLPVQSAPPPNGVAAVVINDKGRLLLSERMGSLVERIEGQITGRSNGVVTMSVHRVIDVRGNASTWTGEQVTIPEDGIMGYRARKVSKFKTALLIGVTVAVVVLTLGTSLDLFGDPKGDDPSGPPQQS
jgi:hypothetical protein